MKPNEFVKKELSINADALSSADQCKLARYILQATAIDTPRIAAIIAKEIEWPKGEAPK